MLSTIYFYQDDIIFDTLYSKHNVLTLISHGPIQHGYLNKRLATETEQNINLKTVKIKVQKNIVAY